MGATETKIIERTRRMIGDTDSSDYQIQTSEMWLFLRDAVEDVGDDISSTWDPDSITADSDFTISPAVDSGVAKLLTIYMKYLILQRQRGRDKYDGVGVTIRGGLDNIDTGTMSRQADKMVVEAGREYKTALNKYNNRQNLYYNTDLYKTTNTDVVSIN